MAYPESTLLTPEEVITPTVGKRADLGTRGYTMDGRVFRYARANTTKLIKGKLCQSRAEAAPGEGWGGATGNYMDTPALLTHGSTDYAAGSTHVYLSATMDSALNVTADYFADGWLYVGGATTEAGQLVKIASNTTMSSSGSSDNPINVQFAAGYTFSEVVDTGSTICMAKNEYDLVEIAASPLTGLPIGVPVCDIAASYYFWLQTWGACPILTGNNTVYAEHLCPSSQTDGALDSASGTTGHESLSHGGGPVAQCMDVHGASGSWVLAFLTLAP